MWVAVVAWFKRHPALCAIGALVLVALGLSAKAKRLQTQRDRARYEKQDAVRAAHIDEASRRAEEAKVAGDKIAMKRAKVDKRHEESLRKEEARHRKVMDKIEEKHEENDSDVDFLRKRITR